MWKIESKMRISTIVLAMTGSVLGQAQTIVSFDGWAALSGKESVQVRLQNPPGGVQPPKMEVQLSPTSVGTNVSAEGVAYLRGVVDTNFDPGIGETFSYKCWAGATGVARLKVVFLTPPSPGNYYLRTPLQTGARASIHLVGGLGEVSGRAFTSATPEAGLNLDHRAYFANGQMPVSGSDEGTAVTFAKIPLEVAFDPLANAYVGYGELPMGAATNHTLGYAEIGAIVVLQTMGIVSVTHDGGHYLTRDVDGTEWPILPGSHSSSGQSRSVKITLKDASGNTLDAFGQTVRPGDTSVHIESFGTYSGAATMTVESSGGLRKVYPFTVAFGVPTVGSSVQLLYGDANGDNAIDLLDYFEVSDFYGLTVVDDEFFEPNASDLTGFSADFNLDGSVDVLDYFILSDNFNMVGD